MKFWLTNRKNDLETRIQEIAMYRIMLSIQLIVELSQNKFMRIIPMTNIESSFFIQFYRKKNW